MSMNALYLVSRLLRSGPTRQLLNIVQQVSREGVRCLVATLSPESKETLIDEFKASGTRVVQLGRGRWSALVTAKNEISELCAAEDVHIIHSQGIRADTLSASIDSRSKTLATLRNVPWLDYRLTYGGVRGTLMAKWHLNALRRLDAVVAVSDAVADAIRLPNMSVIRNGVDVEHFYACDLREREAARVRLNIPLSTKVFVSVGHLSRRKDPITLIEAFQRAGRASEALLVLVGDGPERERCASFAGPHIRVMGRHEDVRPFLAAADFFVSASHAEGFPNAVLEAAAMDRDLVLSDIGPHLELGRAAHLRVKYFAVGDTNALQRALTECMRAPVDGMTGNRQAIISSLSTEQMGKQYASLYSDLLASGASMNARTGTS